MRYLTGRHLSARELAVEREFREPIGAVIAGFAQMGYSRADTARALGWNAEHFSRTVVPRHDPHGEIQWPSRTAERVEMEGRQAVEPALEAA